MSKSKERYPCIKYFKLAGYEDSSLIFFFKESGHGVCIAMKNGFNHYVGEKHDRLNDGVFFNINMRYVE